MKLRKHLRAATKLAAKATANRKAASAPRLSERNSKRTTPPIRKPIRYRIEIWREAEPEIRVYSFPVDWEPGKLTKADVLGKIAPKLFDWFLSKIPCEQWSDWDKGVPGASIWDDQPPYYTATDEDVPF